jgi:hypothetical protein
LECLASIVNLLDVGTADVGILGFPSPVVTDFTGDTTTVAAITVSGTANTDDDDGATYDEMVVIINEVNDAIVTVANHVNDVAAALGVTELVVNASPGLGSQVDTISSATAAAGDTDSILNTVALTDWDNMLLQWRDACGVLLFRVSVVAAGGGNDDWTHQLVPDAEVPQISWGSLVRDRLG